MRKKSENEARDRFARQYAAQLAVESLIRHRAKTAHIRIVVEAEDRPLWDDITREINPGNRRHRHQVKRQLTPLVENDFAEYVRAAAVGAPETHYHFCFPTMLPVQGIGELRILHGLCQRLKQDGADKGKVIANLYELERCWVDALLKWTGLDEGAIMEVLKRIHIDMIGLEDDIDNRATCLLEPIFGNNTEEAWTRIKAFIADKDGVVQITPELLWSRMPSPAVDEVDTFYWSLIEECEESFLFHAWEDLTDSLIRDIIPIEFHDGVLKFVHSVTGSSLPGRYAEVDTALKNVADRAHEYIRYFNTRSEASERWVREDKSYKRIFPNPNYSAEVQRSKRWSKGNQFRLSNLVVSINDLFVSIRSEIRPTFRLRQGKLGIHDQMGVTNEMTGVTYYPRQYVELKDGE